MTVFIAGHSLGAARAYQYAYSRIIRGLPVDGIYALAPPNPGDQMIGVKLSPVFVRSLRNGRDLVPEVPIDLPWLGEEYVQPRAFEPIHEPPPASDPDKLFGWHHISLYVAGANKLAEPGAALPLAQATAEIARLYQTDSGWDWISPVDGAYWAMKVMPGGTRLLIARGSVSLHDWLDDFDATEMVVLGARMARGFWAGVGPYQDQLDKVLEP